jgi:alkylated DNA repair dioxygenase AlkB
MDDINKYFSINKYVTLEGVLSKEHCKKFSDRLFQLKNENKTTIDDQCNRSDAIYGDPVLESLLESLKPILEKATDKSLAPTYAYARIYRPGEVLKPHIDRHACEYSATLTLGMDSKNCWPIYVWENGGKINEVLLDVGDLVVYKGCEVIHWRNAFAGQWQTQVFLHYVDVNGSYSDEAEKESARKQSKVE